jgi:phytoene synthase
MQDAFGHCEALVREADKDRFLATLFAPERYRAPLYALYAFNIEVARVRERAREPLAGEIRLQWWRDTLAGAGGTTSAHPVARALLATVAQYRLPADTLADVIEARAFDLYDDPMDSIDELEGYAVKTASAVMALAARVLNGGDDPGLGALTRPAGIAHAIAGLLGALGVHAARRQLYLPLDFLRRRGARAEDVFAGKASPELQAALAELRAHARGRIAQARSALGSLPAELVPAVLPAALAGPMLDRLERRRGNPFVPDPLPQWRRQWLIWRAARNPARMFG